MIGLNNPYNIRTGSKWLGSCGSTRGFVDFNDVRYCVRAAFIIICRSYRQKGVLTISEIINRWAPSNENNTSKYIEFICSKLACFPFDILSSKEEYIRLLHYISLYESGKINAVPLSAIDRIIDEFGLVVYKCRK